MSPLIAFDHGVLLYAAVHGLCLAYRCHRQLLSTSLPDGRLERSLLGACHKEAKDVVPEVTHEYRSVVFKIFLITVLEVKD